MKWKVAITKSKGKPVKRWAAWRLSNKRKSGKIFDTWNEAIFYATVMSYLDERIKLERRKIK